jgi:hypothetical protein
MGSGRAWAALRYDERREVNKTKIHRLWREEGLQVKANSRRKRAGVSSLPPVEADADSAVAELLQRYWRLHRHPTRRSEPPPAAPPSGPAAHRVPAPESLAGRRRAGRAMRRMLSNCVPATTCSRSTPGPLTLTHTGLSHSCSASTLASTVPLVPNASAYHWAARRIPCPHG